MGFLVLFAESWHGYMNLPHLALNEDACRKQMQSVCDYQGIEWGENCRLDFTDMDRSSYSEE